MGLASNVSNNLSSLGIRSTLCGVVGDDINGALFYDLLKKRKMNSVGIIKDSNRPTTFKERVATSAQQICRIDYENNNFVDQEVEKKINQKILDLKSSHDAIIIEDYAKGTLTKNNLKNIIEMFSGDGKLVAVDPSRKTPPDYYKNATLLKPNQQEASLMVSALGYGHQDSVEKIAEILVDKLNLQMLIITLGADGMALVDVKNSIDFTTIPTLATEVYDVSGAGDTAISLITAGLLAGGNLVEAAWLGNCGAGVVVGKRGTATVNIEELRDYYNRLQKKLKVEVI